MTLVRRLARPLLAAQYIASGQDALRHPARRAEAAAPLIAKLAPSLGLPDDPEMLVRANGAAMLGAGSLLAIGRLPRLSALVLAVTLVPTTWAGHAFWSEKDPTKRAGQRVHFLKNVSMLGGLLIAAVDTEGKPGLAWRAQRATKDVKRSAGLTGKQAKRAAKTAKREAKLAAAAATSKLT